MSSQLSEHQPVEINSSKPDGYNPTDEERQTIRMVERVFEKNKKARKVFDDKWPDYYKYFRGKQWKEARPSYRHSEVVNFVFQTIQSQVPILSDSKQRIEYVAQKPSDIEFARILDEVAESDWQNGNWTYRLAEMLYDGHIYGTAIGELGYDPEARYGEGSITFGSKDLFYCYPDGNAQDTNVKCRNFVIAEPVDISEIKREYPDKGKFVKPDILDVTQNKRYDMEQNKYKSPVDTQVVIEGSSIGEQGSKDQALKITLYLWDDTVEDNIAEPQMSAVDPGTASIPTDQSVTVDNGEPTAQPAPQVDPEYPKKLKYPKGRKICIANGIVLADGEMDLDDRLFPFVRFVNYIDPRSMWGISEVEQLMGPQNIFNKIYSFTLDVLTLMGNPIWIVDNDSEVDTDNLFNRPGLVVEKAKGSEVRREEGTQLQPYVLNILDRVKDYLESVSGSADVSRGVQPTGITAASAITSLQEAAQTRIRQKSRNLDATLQNFGKIYMAYALEKYDTPRVFRVTGEQGAQKYFKFHIEKNEEGQKIARIRDFVQDPETGDFKEDIEEKQILINGDFDVKITTGSSLPFAKDAKFAKARQMFLDGVIDEEEYLKQAEYPNWQIVLQRVQAQKAAAAQAQAAAKAGGGPPPPQPAA